MRHVAAWSTQRTRLGHASIAITMDTYSRGIPGLQEDAAPRIDAALRNAIAGPRGGKAVAVTWFLA
jgi:hypothetical protein